MTTNAEAVAALESSKSALQSQCDAASDQTLDDLEKAIHAISSEIDALEAATLNTAAYMPATDVFKNATAAAQGFVARLNRIKSAFGAVDTVAKAVDSLVKLVTKLAL